VLPAPSSASVSATQHHVQHHLRTPGPARRWPAQLLARRCTRYRPHQRAVGPGQHRAPKTRARPAPAAPQRPPARRPQQSTSQCAAYRRCSHASASSASTSQLWSALLRTGVREATPPR
jgi:hypothetical protein